MLYAQATDKHLEIILKIDKMPRLRFEMTTREEAEQWSNKVNDLCFGQYANTILKKTSVLVLVDSLDIEMLMKMFQKKCEKWLNALSKPHVVECMFEILAKR
jgi:hypothetical protein